MVRRRHRTPLLTTLLLGVGLSLTGLAGCGDSGGGDTGAETGDTDDTGDTDETGDTGAPEPPSSELTGTVTSDGLVLVGEPFTPLEGVRLEIPAGAVDEGTEITLAVTLDPTLLPARAYAVGPHVAVGPDDVVFAEAATLTLPVYLDTVFSLGAGPGSDEDAVAVKVWLKGPEDVEWTLAEDVTGVDLHTAQLPIEGPGVAGAGVKTDLPPDAPLCLGDGGCASIDATAEAVDAATCDVATAPCIADLGEPDPPVGLPTLAPATTSVVYVALEADGSGDLALTAVRFDPADGSTATSQSWTAPAAEIADAGRARALVVDGQGTAWLALRDRLIGFPFDDEGAPPATETPLDEGATAHTVGLTADRTLVWLAQLGDTVRVRTWGAGATEWSASEDVAVPWSALDTPYPRVAAHLVATTDPSAIRALWVTGAALGGEVARLVLGDNGLSVDGALVPTTGGETPLPDVVGGLDGRVAVIGRDGLAVEWLGGGQAATPVVGGAVALAPALANGLWAGAVDHATVLHLPPDAPAEALALPSEADPDAAADAIPRALARLDNGWLIVLDRGGRLIRVR